ncbi:MAG: tyrosine-type recombinase/integrase [Saprospiraceae bacterium]
MDRNNDEPGGANKRLTSLIDQFMEDARERKKYAESTLQGYSSLKELIIRYSTGGDIDLSSLDRAYYMGFQQWMYSEDYSSNYVQKQWSRLKTVLRFGTDEGQLEDQDPIFRKLPVKKVDTDHIYLTDDEIERVASLNLEENPRLRRIRDIFLVGAYTGLRFCDLIRLETSHVSAEKGSRIIRMVMKKTNREVVIPCKPFVYEVLMRYGGRLPQLSDVSYNRYLKEVGQKAGLDGEVKMRSYEGGVVGNTSFRKWEKLTSHTARRSFATNLFKQGVSPVVIQKMTGHTNTKVLMSYIKMDGEESAVMMAGHSFFS